MSKWSDLATWRGPTVNQGGRMLEQRGLVIHIAEGTFEGTISWCKNPTSNVSTHFVTDTDGTIAQMIDTDVTAWTQQAGNGHWLSVENAGHTPAPLTAPQIEACAKLLARGHTQYGYPLQIAVNPDGRGLGHHSMGCNWPAGAWGHCDCPGPAIIAQKPAILARAIEIIGGGNMDEKSIAAAVVSQLIGASGPTVGVGIQSTFNGQAPAMLAIMTKLTEIEAKVDALATGGVDLEAVKAAAHEGAATGAATAIDGAAITGTISAPSD
jgi:hypothetical protein